MPVIDDCRAKCTYRTTIEADARYTHLISNGDVCRTTNPDGKPSLKPDDPTRKIITYENDIPMAPYLFIACVGTWDALEDELVYPSGRRVRLEYLVPPGHIAGAKAPMRILKDAILWQNATQDYEYQREVYRTICMEKSNFGGMENVGNTAIVTSAALVDEFTTDSRLEYAYAVTVHEFEHNQCGSDVTMETPFDMWLNEAFTVDVDRQFSMARFDPVCKRLAQVDAMRAPTQGPLSVEEAGLGGAIVREGFNSPDELVDGVTYVKAAEVIRMLRLILGAQTFRQAKNLYFSRYSGSNANTRQFFECFEEVSGRDLTQFRNEWLHSSGYPVIKAARHYDPRSRTLSVSFGQSRIGQGGMFHLPLEMAAVDSTGRDIPGTHRTVEILSEKTELTFTDVPLPTFLSFNRDCSFYGVFFDSCATSAELAAQARLDPNLFNRVEAMRELTDIERRRLIEDPDAEISQLWLDTYRLLLNDDSLKPGFKAQLIAIDEMSKRRELLPMYRERYTARAKLLKTVARTFFDRLVAMFHACDTYSRSDDPAEGLDRRRLKAVLLRILAELDAPETHAIAENHFEKAWNFSDKLSALLCINLSSSPRRMAYLQRASESWRHHINGYTGYLSVVSSGIHDDVWAMMEAEEKRPLFRPEHPSHARALYLPMASNNKMLWTDRGLQWVSRTVARLARINEITAIRLVDCLQMVDKLAHDIQPAALAALRDARRAIDPQSVPALAGRIDTFLAKCQCGPSR